MRPGTMVLSELTDKLTQLTHLMQPGKGYFITLLENLAALTGPGGAAPSDGRISGLNVTLEFGCFPIVSFHVPTMT